MENNLLKFKLSWILNNNRRESYQPVNFPLELHCKIFKAVYYFKLKPFFQLNVCYVIQCFYSKKGNACTIPSLASSKAFFSSWSLFLASSSACFLCCSCLSFSCSSNVRRSFPGVACSLCFRGLSSSCPRKT